ncbi:hypothetical protein RHMOL_Rhmol12G0050500 [Rhododendron molle]|uniref:Uncharacterized protein n=1 Tax=Rhododendron molle TaxID=49168 RepID=A0ACC0LFN2_RHOML|nr:hypothetical protein RHMOL_Rhmol12G0050500 [Rhododendron molle]
MWRPLFITPEKCQITADDSLASDPSIARTLFHDLALSKDITLPDSLKLAINDHYFHSGWEKKKAFDEGYSQGYNKAGDELVDQVEKAEVLLKQQQHAESYVLGYCKALDEAGVATDDARRTAIEIPLLAESEPAAEDEEENADADIDAAENIAEDHTVGVESTTTPVQPTTTPKT